MRENKMIIILAHCKCKRDGLEGKNKRLEIDNEIFKERIYIRK